MVRPHHEEAAQGKRVRVVFEGAEYRGRFRQTVWDGSARIEGNRILRAEKINFFNPLKAFEQTAADALRWEAVTTGNFAGFDVWLEDSSAGTLRFETEPARFELPVAEIRVEDRVYEGGKLGRRARVFRLPDEKPASQSGYRANCRTQKGSGQSSLRRGDPRGRSPRLVEPDLDCWLASGRAKHAGQAGCFRVEDHPPPDRSITERFSVRQPGVKSSLQQEAT